MRVIKTIASLRGELAEWRARGDQIALVPTMGNLHEGHLRLVDEAKSCAQRVVVSIFINPLQFDDPNDFSAYPSTFDEDRSKLDKNGVDIVFFPEVTEMYPQGMQHHTSVTVPDISDILCGAHRPGHFRGVATVVHKLLNIVQPDVALFGEKDYQQLQVIRRMVRDLALPVDIVAVPTVREQDGLALSSRNSYLTADERRHAPRLYQVLMQVKGRIEQGASDFHALENDALMALQQGGFRPEYVSVCRADNLAPAGPEDTDLAILAAAWLGKARLIDSLQVALPPVVQDRV
ncbi:MAG: pantoate--beta-alanine ligase [Gammaproteobacteria bacterium]|nr:pantoate--beta-alanine ligase [Gammaproteobacteria bacterium]